MNKDEYKKLVKKLSPKEPRLRNFGVSFLVGGLFGILAEVGASLITYAFAISKVDAYAWIALIVIFLTTLLTALGFFDTWVSYIKCGLIIPTSGFAHSITSSALDYKKDGMITGLGSNFFKLAGSVLLYGTISAFFLIVLRVIISG